MRQELSWVVSVEGGLKETPLQTYILELKTQNSIQVYLSMILADFFEPPPKNLRYKYKHTFGS